MTFAEAVEQACKRSDLTKALTYIAVWEHERTISSIRANGKPYETLFGRCISAVIERWNREHG
jgi:hypothetical protein